MNKCKTCTKDISHKRSNARYCDRACKRKDEWQRHRNVMEEAGTPIKSHGGNHTGKVGKEHYAYKTGIGLFKTKLAKAYYVKVRYCERCNKDLLNIAPSLRAVHHIDHDRSNNIESNFELLCKRCHQVEHECWKAFDSM